MRTVYKYSLSLSYDQHLILPDESSILSVQFQTRSLFCWALVNPLEKKQESRKILIFGTGHDIEDTTLNLIHLGTVKDDFNSFVWHIFEDNHGYRKLD